MKDQLTNSEFPRDAHGATYHVATKSGEVANRIIICGDYNRARRIAAHFDGGKPTFEKDSQRKFLTLTGTRDGVPLTVIAIGMGPSVVDFFLRECRAVVEGEMIIVRVGSCGSIDPSIRIGTVVAPLWSFGILRNYDYFHPSTTAEERASGSIEPFIITKPLEANQEVHDKLSQALQDTRPEADAALFDGRQPTSQSSIVNGSSDSFYGSQGRQDLSFMDCNANLIETLRQRHAISTLEMETYFLNHLALSANLATQMEGFEQVANSKRIRTGAIQMVFADRHSGGFISPQEVEALEEWAGKAACEALIQLKIN